MIFVRGKDQLVSELDVTKGVFKNIYMGVDGIYRTTPVEMPFEVLYKFDGQIFEVFDGNV